MTVFLVSIGESDEPEWVGILPGQDGVYNPCGFFCDACGNSRSVTEDLQILRINGSDSGDGAPLIDSFRLKQLTGGSPFRRGKIGGDVEVVRIRFRRGKGRRKTVLRRRR